MNKMIRKLLVANRGEVALRVARTCKEMGIKAVAVYTREEKNSLHASICDEGIEIEGKGVKAYLEIENLIKAAQKSSCQAIHPGWGFLSENPNFALACEKAKILFVGPTSEHIQEIGDKAKAKRLAAELNIPTTKSVWEKNPDEAGFLTKIEKLGFPILLKPQAGGGGKGMVVVHQKKELKEALLKARKEAQSAFGNRRMLAEQFINPVRHVEVQIVGDGKGKVKHLFERDCTLQRRHQKILEESPSPFLNHEALDSLFKDALTLTKAIKYRNLGTVEFILDSQGHHYFMEMNTRLQVEHPVTEERVGLDLVRIQILLAQGESLESMLKSMNPEGHSLEVRIYAEDPEQHFLPATGKVLRMILPKKDYLRIDSGIQEGMFIGHAFDPLLMKMVVCCENREDAIRKLEKALYETVILGVNTNINFLRWVLSHHEFRKSRFDTLWAERNIKDYQAWEVSNRADIPIAIVKSQEHIMGRHKVKSYLLDEENDWENDPRDPWIMLKNWRLGRHGR